MTVTVEIPGGPSELRDGVDPRLIAWRRWGSLFAGDGARPLTPEEAREAAARVVAR